MTASSSTCVPHGSVISFDCLKQDIQKKETEKYLMLAEKKIISQLNDSTLRSHVHVDPFFRLCGKHRRFNRSRRILEPRAGSLARGEPAGAFGALLAPGRGDPALPPRRRPTPAARRERAGGVGVWGVSANQLKQLISINHHVRFHSPYILPSTWKDI